VANTTCEWVSENSFEGGPGSLEAGGRVAISSTIGPNSESKGRKDEQGPDCREIRRPASGRENPRCHETRCDGRTHKKWALIIVPAASDQVRKGLSVGHRPLYGNLDSGPEPSMRKRCFPTWGWQKTRSVRPQRWSMPKS